MLNTTSLPWLIGGWIATVAVFIAISVAMDAERSTIALVVALAVAPAVVIALLRGGGSSQTVAEILHAVDTTDGRP